MIEYLCSLLFPHFLYSYLNNFGTKFVIFSLQNPVEKIFSVIWLIFQPILFGLIGTEINLKVLDQDTVIYGISVLIVGLIVSLYELILLNIH